MQDYIEVTDNYDRGSYARSATRRAATPLASAMTGVYTWMAAALCITAAVAYITIASPTMLQLIYGNAAAIWVLVIAELALVMGISGGINRLSPTTATVLFLVYAAVNGLTLSSIFFVYTAGTIAQAFAASALTFGGMSLVGATTKRDLSGMGGMLVMGLIGLIVASVVNMFWANSMLDTIITYIGVFIFVGLTAYDTQKIKAMMAHAEAYGDAAAPRRVAIVGALSLYLDFINLFLYILRLFGRSRD